MRSLTAVERRAAAEKLAAARRARRRSAAVLDGLVHAVEGRVSGGMSPIVPELALFDWGVHLANAPFRRAELMTEAAQAAARLVDAACGETVIEPQPDDHRFRDPAWSRSAVQLL